MRRPLFVPWPARFALFALFFALGDGAPVGAADVGREDPYDTDAALAAHAEDVADYALRATLDPALHSVHGEGTITWKNASSTPVRELWVHLYLNAFKNEKSAFMRERAGAGFRGGAVPSDWGYIDVRRFALVDPTRTSPTVDLWPLAETRRPGDDDETDARVPLPREIAPGASATIEVSWDAKLPTVVERTGYEGSFHMVGQWFPKIARLEPDGRWAHFPFHHLAEFYADYGTYDVTIDVPDSFIVGATGPLVDARVENRRRIERHVQQDIHDFAWTAWDRWQTETETIEGVATRVLFPPGYRALAERELATIRFALPYYGAHYGRYPYSVLTLVHPPAGAEEAGGMEYPTLITTGESSWYDPPGILSAEIVTIHEFGHQYFYGLVASDEVSWPFLDEGVNSFAEEDAMARWRGAGSAADVLGLTLSDAAIQATFGNFSVHNERVAQPAPAFVTGADYGNLVYERTGAILETLRRVWGDAGVMRALGRYARRYRFRHPGPEEFVATFDEVLGTRAAQELHAALFDKGWVDYAITGIDGRPAAEAAGIFDRDGKRETVATPKDPEARKRYEGAVLVTRRGTLSFPVDVELYLADGSTQRLHWDGEDENHLFPYEGSSPLRGAVVDPDRAVTLDPDDANNHLSLSGPVVGAPRTLERATYWGQLLVQVMGP